jgi:Flp pilus assembly protein TadD
LKKAAEVATRTMQGFPGDADAARLAASVFRQARDWKPMESAAQQWRARSLERPEDADVAIAEARLESGNAAGAVAQLAPYAATASAAPDDHAALLITYARSLAAAGREPDARALLEPLLPRSSRWRRAWIGIADSDLKDAKAATAWLDLVMPRVMTDTDPERLVLARAWYTVGARQAVPKALQHAKEILLPLAEKKEASVDVFLLLASVNEAAGDVDAAETNYRKALAIRPDESAALNNLAYLLLTRGGSDLTEAQSLASRAVSVAPGVASFHDTLARVRMKAGDRKGALLEFQKALDIEPDHIEAMIGKATVLAELGERAAVRDLIQQIDAMLPRKPNLSNELKRELESARNNLSASIDRQ